MAKQRLLFVKEAQASYLSHLDLMRSFQRIFLRAGFTLKHSQGFHPHPLLSIVLPLPVGQSSQCELLDFETVQDELVDVERLNEVMPLGLRALDCYVPSRPTKELTTLVAEVELLYDNGLPAEAKENILSLLAQEEVIVEKRTKHKDLAQVNIRPMILSVEAEERPQSLLLHLAVQAQNPGLNPALLEQAIGRYLPDCKPDFVRVRRKNFLDANGVEFR